MQFKLSYILFSILFLSSCLQQKVESESAKRSTASDGRSDSTTLETPVLPDDGNQDEAVGPDTGNGNPEIFGQITVVLNSPSTSPSVEEKPTLKIVGKLEAGDKIVMYRDSTGKCSSQYDVIDVDYNSSSIIVNGKKHDPGVASIYSAKHIRGSQVGRCSAQTASYQRLAVGGVTISLSKPTTSPSHEREPEFKITGDFYPNDRIKLYKSDSDAVRCTQEIKSLDITKKLNFIDIVGDTHGFGAVGYYSARIERGLSQGPCSEKALRYERKNVEIPNPINLEQLKIELYYPSVSPGTKPSPRLKVLGSFQPGDQVILTDGDQCQRNISSTPISTTTSEILIDAPAHGSNISKLYGAILRRGTKSSDCPKSKVSYRYSLGQDHANPDLEPQESLVINSVSLENPTHSPGMVEKPSIRINGHFKVGDHITLYADADGGCSGFVGVESVKENTNQIIMNGKIHGMGSSLTYSAKHGRHTKYGPCSLNNTSYQRLPVGEISVSLESPNRTPGTDPNPKFKITGSFAKNDVIEVFADATTPCKGAKIQTHTLESAENSFSFQIINHPLNVQKVYSAKAYRNGIPSNCSLVNATYRRIVGQQEADPDLEEEGPQPDILPVVSSVVLNNPLSSPGNISKPSLKVNGNFKNGDRIELYADGSSACSGVVAGSATISTPTASFVIINGITHSLNLQRLYSAKAYRNGVSGNCSLKNVNYKYVLGQNHTDPDLEPQESLAITSVKLENPVHSPGMIERPKLKVSGNLKVGDSITLSADVDGSCASVVNSKIVNSSEANSKFVIMDGASHGMALTRVYSAKLKRNNVYGPCSLNNVSYQRLPVGSISVTLEDPTSSPGTAEKPKLKISGNFSAGDTIVLSANESGTCSSTINTQGISSPETSVVMDGVNHAVGMTKIYSALVTRSGISSACSTVKATYKRVAEEPPTPTATPDNSLTRYIQIKVSHPLIAFSNGIDVEIGKYKAGGAKEELYSHEVTTANQTYTASFDNYVVKSCGSNKNAVGYVKINFPGRKCDIYVNSQVRQYESANSWEETCLMNIHGLTAVYELKNCNHAEPPVAEHEPTTASKHFKVSFPANHTEWSYAEFGVFDNNVANYGQPRLKYPISSVVSEFDVDFDRSKAKYTPGCPANTLGRVFVNYGKYYNNGGSTGLKCDIYKNGAKIRTQEPASFMDECVLDSTDSTPEVVHYELKSCNPL
jgi:hypothetical protein